MNKPLTLGSLFDGSGGFPLAGLLAGIVPVWSSEIEPFAIRVTEKRLPQVQHFGNISGLHGAKLTAFVYIMHEERKLGIPTSAYIRTCVDGYRQFGFDLKHLRKAVDISEREVYHHENG